jgi:hypothetical protein
MTVRRAILSVIICMLLCGPVSAAGGARVRVLDHFGVDSLVYLSEIIVRAKVGTSQKAEILDGNCQVYEVETLNVLKGAVRVGETFSVAGLDEYRRAPGIADVPDSWDPIKQGDVVYLFLRANDGKRGYSKYLLTRPSGPSSNRAFACRCMSACTASGRPCRAKALARAGEWPGLWQSSWS